VVFEPLWREQSLGEFVARRATVSERLLLDFDAFFLGHGLCGELDAGVDGPIVWFVCDCGARMVRRADETTHL
jgi:hypothetical protein